MVAIRLETPDDVEAVAEVERAAFGGPAEANLVDRLRNLGQLAVSLVAVSEARVIGHIAFSPMTLSPNPEALRATGLAPLAVLPAQQRRGIGAQLVRAGLRACAGTGTRRPAPSWCWSFGPAHSAKPPAWRVTTRSSTTSSGLDGGPSPWRQ